MTDFLTRLAERTLGLRPPVQPVFTSVYGSAPALATDFELDWGLKPSTSPELAGDRSVEAQPTESESPDNPGNDRQRLQPLTVQSDRAIANIAEFDSAILSSPQPTQPNNAETIPPRTHLLSFSQVFSPMPSVNPATHLDSTFLATDVPIEPVSAETMSWAVSELAGDRSVEAQPTESESPDNPGNDRQRSQPLTVQSDRAIANSAESNSVILSSPQPAQTNNAETSPPQSHPLSLSQVLSPRPSANPATRLDSTFLATDVPIDPVNAETMPKQVRAAAPLPLGSLVSESQTFSDSFAAEVILEQQQSDNQTVNFAALLYSDNKAKSSGGNRDTPTAKANPLSGQLPATKMRSQVRAGTSQQHELASQANQVDSPEEKISPPGSLGDTAERAAIRVSLFGNSVNAGSEQLSFQQSELEVAFLQAASEESAARLEMPAVQPLSQRERIDSLLALESISGKEGLFAGEQSRSLQQEAVPTSTPTIQVSIGRIEVRSTQPPTRSTQFVRPEPRLSLSEYLKQRQGGKP